MSSRVPWETKDIYHDDPGSFPLEDFLPLSMNKSGAEEETLHSMNQFEELNHEEEQL